MNDLQVFSFKSFPVRTVIKDGEPWFVAADVCNVLGIGNSRDAMGRLPATMRDDVGITDTIGRSQTVNAVNEAGLYKLAFTSRKPEAEAFTDWVATDVLPSIRKTGSYAVKPMTALDALAQTVAVLQEQERRVAALESTVKVIKETICDRPDDWRTEINKALTRICFKLGGGDKYRELRRDSYAELERRAGCDLDRRLANLKERAVGRIPKKAYEALCNLDVIGEDKKLREIYWAIIRELAVKYSEEVAI